MKSSQRVIAHLDMDAFYASAEMVRRPELKGRPVVVGGPSGLKPMHGQDHVLLKQYKGRGVLTTANYEARALGLRSAMPTMKAAKLAPDAVLLPVDFDWYKILSRQFKQAVLKHVPLIEDRGIDEIYLDMSEVVQGDFDRAVELAGVLQQAVESATGGMTCSVGISQNKLTSKICSDLNKPKGISLVRPEEFTSIIWPMPASKINGIGPKTAERLRAIGVVSIAELAAVPLEELLARFGRNYGQWLHDSAWGRDERPIQTLSAPKSISRETTFSNDLHVKANRAQLSEVLLKLSNRLEADLRRKGLWAKTIGVKVRFADFKSLTRDHTLDCAVQREGDIVNAARLCLKKVPFTEHGNQSQIRLLGVKVSHLLGPPDALSSTATTPGVLSTGLREESQGEGGLALKTETITQQLRLPGL